MSSGKTILSVALALTCTQVRAQIYTTGTDRQELEWNSTCVGRWNVTAPALSDSLARRYASRLEYFAPLVGASIGREANVAYPGKPMGVVLHAESSVSNGMVSWAPRRMELYSCPESLGPEPVVWEDMLAIHEGRHVAQMQFASMKPYRPLKWLVGEVWTGAATGLYLDQSFLEGDAVATETALTQSGRGRTADFLEYIRACSLEGQERSFWQWRYGSLSRYTPDYYRAGYMLHSGVRAFLDVPDFAGRYIDAASRKFLRWPSPRRFFKEATGLRAGPAVDSVFSRYASLWAEEASSRAPYTPSGKPLTAQARRFVSYSRLEAGRGGIYAVRSGIDEPSTLVFLDSLGTRIPLRPFSASTGLLSYSAATGRLYWSEIIQDRRWEHASTSQIRYLGSDGKTGTLLEGGRFFNPASDGEGFLAAVEYPVEGRSNVIVCSEDMSVVYRYPVPSGWQAVECVWDGRKLLVSVITPEGFIIAEAGSWKRLYEPGHVKIKNLKSAPGGVLFESDLTGVNEMWLLPSGGEPVQLTSSQVGASCGVPYGDGIAFTALSSSGRSIRAVPYSSLPGRTGAVKHDWTVEQTLSEQESAFRAAPGDTSSFSTKPYDKARHAFKVHSWWPVMAPFDDVASLTGDLMNLAVLPGATVLFQNDLGSVYGSASAGVPLSKVLPAVQAHANIVWRGIYPVFEATLDVGDRFRRQYRTIANDGVESVVHQELDDVSARGSLRAYVPLNFSSGGWSRGIVPCIGGSVTNDRYSLSRVFRRSFEGLDGLAPFYTLESFTEGPDPLYFSSYAYVSGYVLRSKSPSQVYPRLGVGTQIGYSFRPDVAFPFVYVYGYLPGLSKRQGMRLSTTLQGGKYGPSAEFTFDYALPFASLECDWLCPFAYLKNLELDPHFEWRSAASPTGREILWNAGADFCVRLGNLSVIPYETLVGVSARYGCNGKMNYGLVLSIEI